MLQTVKLFHSPFEIVSGAGSGPVIKLRDKFHNAREPGRKLLIPTLSLLKNPGRLQIKLNTSKFYANDTGQASHVRFNYPQ